MDNIDDLLYHWDCRPNLSYYSREKICSIGVMVVSIILLNAGVFPLIAATLGLIQIIMVIEHNARPGVRQYLLVSRILFFLSIGLTVAGGVLKGSDSSSDAITEVKLVKAGYFSAVAFVACLFAVQGHFWTQFSRLSHTSQMILKSIILALPFMVVRITYLFLSVSHASDLRWSALAGPMAPFFDNGIIDGILWVLICLFTRFIIPPWKRMRVIDQE